MTHTERIAAAWGLGLGLLAVIGFAFDRWVLAVWWWPWIGWRWRQDRWDRQAIADGDDWIPPDLGQRFVDTVAGTTPDWDDEPSTDDDADQMIATWHGTADPTNARSAGQPGSDRATSQPDASLPPYASGEEHEQLAPVHPIYLDLSDDPDLIVWDAKQQADRCWEIVHIEFPRLRAELAHMWEAAA